MKNTESAQNESLFLSLLDINTIQNIFMELIVEKYIEDSTILQNQIEDKSKSKKQTDSITYYFKSFLDCSSFSSTCKIFYEISKNTKFEINIFENQKIQNISYSIYIKLNCVKQQAMKYKYFGNPDKLKEETLNYMLIFSSKNGFYDIVKPLIENGANINFKVKNSWEYSLFHSCKNGYLKTSKKLIKYGSKINHRNFAKETPLHLACETNNLQLIQFLVEKGANIHVQNIFKKNILFKACDFGNLDIVKYLINQGSNIKHQNDKKQTILFAACKSKNEELIQYLINLGLNINHLDQYQRTCIYFTCVDQDLETTKYLILKGADLKIKYHNNKTLLEILKNERNQNNELIEELQKYFLN